MRLLLDTCTFLWAAREPEKLSSIAIEAMLNPSTERFLSAVTVWEVCQKARLEKIGLKMTADAFFRRATRDLRLKVIPVEATDALGLETLPLIHRDPFDRMLVAQAKARALTLVTSDETIRRYDVPILW